MRVSLSKIITNASAETLSRNNGDTKKVNKIRDLLGCDRDGSVLGSIVGGG